MKKQRDQFTLETLEPRILLSGDGLVDVDILEPDTDDHIDEQSIIIQELEFEESIQSTERSQLREDIVSDKDFDSNLLLIEGTSSPDRQGLQLVDSDTSQFEGQIFWINFGNEQDLTYKGPVTIDGIDSPAYKAPDNFIGQEDFIKSYVIDQLNDTFGIYGVAFTLDKPISDPEYSTIYVGGNDSQFSEYGSFLGLAEQVDIGNKDRNDNAFVFSDNFNVRYTGIEEYAETLFTNIVHEASHLLGYKHATIIPELSEPVILENYSDGTNDLSNNLFTIDFKDDKEIIIERNEQTEYLFDENDSDSQGVILIKQDLSNIAAESYTEKSWAPNWSIPDDNQLWVWEWTPSISGSGYKVTKVKTGYEFTHSWHSDIDIRIKNYTDGHEWWVREDEGGSNSGTVSETRTEYSVFDEDDPEQKWTFGIRDDYTGDTGKLNSMYLKIYYSTPDSESGEIVSVSSPTFVGGQTSTVTVRVHNTGPSDDMIIEWDSKPSGWSISPGDLNPHISSNGYYNATFNVTPPVSGGSGTIVWKFYDDDIGVHPFGSDLLDSWNQSVSATVSKPDLTIHDFDAENEPWRWGTQVQIDIDIYNEGNANADNVDIKLIASNNTYLGDSDDYLIRTWYNQDIAAYQHWKQSNYTWTLPETPYSNMSSDGSVYYFVQVEQASGETDTSDNHKSDTVDMNPAEQGEIVSVSSPTFIGGQTSAVTVRVHNIGLSDHMIIEWDSAPSGWSISPTNLNPYISSSGYYNATFNVTPPVSGGSGTIVWKFYDDDAGYHPSGSDLLDIWNQSVSATASKPDLAVQKFDAEYEPWRWGTQAQIDIDIYNEGNANADNVDIKLIVSNDTTLGDSDDYLIKTWTNQDIASYQHWEQSNYTWTLPETPYSNMPSDGYVYYIVQVEQASGETDTSDNYKLDGVNMNPAEQGEIVSVSSPTFVGGQTSTITVRVHNIGLSDHMIIEWDSKPSGWSISPGDLNPYISSDGYYNAEFEVTPPVSGGSGKIVWKFYDDDVASNDLLDSWNQSVSATASKPDLSIQNVYGVQSSYLTTDSINAHVNVKNIGDASAENSKVHYYLGTATSSTYKYIESGDIGGISPLNDMSAGETDTDEINGTWDIPDNTPAETYYIYVHTTTSSDDPNDSSTYKSSSNNWSRSTAFTISPPFVPYFDDVRIPVASEIDVDNDGYVQQFAFEFDVDSNVSGQFYVELYEDDPSIGGWGDDWMWTSPTFSVNGTTNDYHSYTIITDDHGLSHGEAEFVIKLYNASTGSLIDTWSKNNDSDLGGVKVEYANEDTLPDLAIQKVYGVQSSYLTTDSINAYVDVKNIGGSTANNSEVDYYLGTSSNSTYMSIESNASIGYGDMSAGEEDTDEINGTWAIPDNIPSETYYIYVHTTTSSDDPNDSSTYKSSSNNWSRSNAFTISQPFVPYFDDVRIPVASEIDVDDDGYVQQFDFEFDVDSNVSGQFYVELYEDDPSIGGWGDDWMWTSPAFSVSGTTDDYHSYTIITDDHGLSHGEAEFVLKLYDAATDDLIDTWSKGDDSDLGDVNVEYSYENDTTVPNQVPDLIMEGGTSWNMDNTPKFSWSTPYDASGIAGYWWSVDNPVFNKDEWSWQSEDSFNGESVNSEALTDGFHIFRIFAVDDSGNFNQGPLKSLSFTIDANNPSKPSTNSPGSLSSSDPTLLSDSTPTFEWNLSNDGSGSGVKSYSIDIDYLNGIGIWQNEFEKNIGNTDEYTLKNSEALNTDQYKWRVKAVDGVDKDTWSDWRYFDVKGKSDLVVRDIKIEGKTNLTDAIIKSGDEITIDAESGNIGNENSNSNIQYKWWWGSSENDRYQEIVDNNKNSISGEIATGNGLAPNGEEYEWVSETPFGNWDPDNWIVNLEPGTYWLTFEIDNPDGNAESDETNNWRSEQFIVQDRFEGNNTHASATDLTDEFGILKGEYNTLQQVSIHSSMDSDYYMFKTAGSGEVTVTISDFISSDNNLSLYLYDETNRLNEYKNTDNNLETITFTATAHSLYYLKVSGNTNHSENYKLNITAPETINPFDHVDFSSTAGQAVGNLLGKLTKLDSLSAVENFVMDKLGGIDIDIDAAATFGFHVGAGLDIDTGVVANINVAKLDAGFGLSYGLSGNDLVEEGVGGFFAGDWKISKGLSFEFAAGFKASGEEFITLHENHVTSGFELALGIGDPLPEIKIASEFIEVGATFDMDLGTTTTLTIFTDFTYDQFNAAVGQDTIEKSLLDVFTPYGDSFWERVTDAVFPIIPIDTTLDLLGLANFNNSPIALLNDGNGINWEWTQSASASVQLGVQAGFAPTIGLVGVSAHVGLGFSAELSGEYSIKNVPDGSGVISDFPDIVDIKWENGAGQELPDDYMAKPGEAVYIAVDTKNMRGTDASVFLYEVDPAINDSINTPIVISIPTDSDTGRVLWNVEWHKDANFSIDEAPEYKVYEREGDTFIARGESSHLLQVAEPTLRWETANENAVPATGASEGTTLKITVDGLGYNSDTILKANILEDDFIFNDDIGIEVTLSHSRDDKWVGTVHNLAWRADSFSSLGFLDVDPEYYFEIEELGLKSDTVHIHRYPTQIYLEKEHTEGDGIPLVLLHGAGSDAEGDSNYRWDTMLNYIDSDISANYDEFDIYIWTRSTSLPIGFNGAEFSQADLLRYSLYEDANGPMLGSNVNDAVLVAHSQGGLVARSFMNTYDTSLGYEYGADVTGLITLGTPHHGSPFAVPDWDAATWGDVFGTGLVDQINLKMLVGNGGLGFDSNSWGSVQLAWDNMDGAVDGTNTTIFPTWIYSLTEGDLNINTSPSDLTNNYPIELKNQFGTLKDLNNEENYFDKIITFAAYDDSLFDNWVYEEVYDKLGILANGGLNIVGEHGGLTFLTRLLSDFDADSGINYYANDGMVPLQSALLLDIDDNDIFAEKDILQDVDIFQTTIESQRQVSEHFIFNGDDYDIKDHLDLLDTDNNEYWSTLTTAVRSFLPEPEINVTGNNITILDNDTDNYTIDGTNFGSVIQGQTSPNRIFKVENQGTDVLTIGSFNLPAGFSIVENLDSNIGAGEFDTFTVRMDTSVTGVYEGQISFATNDSDENPFNFTITGTVIEPPEPEIIVFGNSQNITDGDNSPSTSDHTDFGSIEQGQTGQSRTFTVENIGNADLTLGSVILPNGFILTEGLSSTLTAGTSDTFTIQLHTSTVGSYEGNISFVTNDSDENPFNFTITGIVTEQPVSEIVVLGNSQNITDNDDTPSTSDHTDFGSIEQGQAGTSRTFTVENIGNADLTLGSLTLPNGFILTEGLSSNLTARASDTFTIQLDTSEVGTYEGIISFVNNDSDENPFNFKITGIVTEQPVPEIVVLGNSQNITDGDNTPSTSDNTDFGSVEQGQAGQTRTFSVENIGNADLTLGSVTLSNGFTLTEGLSSNLTTGESDTFTIQLDTSTVGTYEGTISFASNDSDENPFNFTISGIVTEQPVPEIVVFGNNQNITDGDDTPSTSDHTDFGRIEHGQADQTRSFTVENTGNADLILGSVSLPNGFSLTEGLSSTLTAGVSDTFTIQLDTSAVGTYEGNISFVTNDSDENPFNFTISGIVTEHPVPEIVVLGNSQNITDGDNTPYTSDHTGFGSIEQGQVGQTRTFTVENTGNADLTLGSVTLPNGFNLTEGLSSTLTAGTSDTFTIQLDAATVGTYEGTISFATNDSDENPFNFTISGIVTEQPVPEIVVFGNNQDISDGDDTPSLSDHTDFGSIEQGQAGQSRTFIVENTGKADLTLGSVILPNGFTLTEGLSNTLTAGSSDTFTIQLDAFTAGTYEGTISFATNDSDENPFNFTISGIVTEQAVPEIVVLGNSQNITDGDNTPSTSDHTDFGSIEQGQAGKNRIFTVENIGNADLTLDSVTLPNGFTLTEGLVNTLIAGASDTFTIQLDTSTVGTYEGTISFVTNDSDENPFSFTISGIVTEQPEPEIVVFGNSQDIQDGDDTPSLSDHTDFGSVEQGQADQTRTFTVENTGNADLTLASVSLPNGFTLTEGLNSSLIARASDTFTIQLDTSAVGTYEGIVSFVNNDSDENPFNFTITGIVTEQSVPEIVALGNNQNITDGDNTPSTSDYTDFGSIEQGQAGQSRTFTVQNIGNADLTLGSVTLSNGFTLTEGLSNTLTAGSSDTFTIQLDTSTVGTYEGTISFATNDSDENPFSFTITGIVVEPPESEITVFGNSQNILDGDNTASLSDHTDFGSVEQGQTGQSRTFTVENTGNADLTLGSVILPNGFTLTEGLSSTLITGASDTFTIQLDTSTVGIYEGNISFVSNDSDENPFNFTITGIVVEPPESEITVFGNSQNILDGDNTASLSDHTDFGSIEQGQTGQSRTFTVENIGEADLTLGSVTLPNGFILTEGLSSSLAAGVSDTFTIQLGASEVGTYEGTISFANNDSDENPFNFTITGTVTEQPVPEIVVFGNNQNITDGDDIPSTSDDTDFGSIEQEQAGQSRTFTVENIGNAGLTLGSVTLPNGFSLTEGLSSTLTAGTSDTFTIQLDTSEVGTYEGNISFVNNDSDENPFNFTVSGIVTEQSLPEIVVLGNSQNILDGDNTASLSDHTDFGSVERGQASLSRTFTVENNGNSELTLGSVSLPNGFTLTEGLSTSVATGTSDTFTIQLNTSAVGIYEGNISFITNDSDENPFNFTISGIVTEQPLPEIVVLGNSQNILGGDDTPSTSDHTDFGSIELGQSIQSRTFTVENIGDADLTLGSVTLPNGFSLTEGLSSSLIAGASDTFTIQLDTSAVGTYEGNISFVSNDSDENPFNFTITGTVTEQPVPEIVVFGNNQNIADGDDTPSLSKNTDFGSVEQWQLGQKRTFTVLNIGNADLILSSVNLSDGFNLTEGLSTTIAAGTSDTFTVQLVTSEVGKYEGEISFRTNDSDENLFNFKIAGTVIEKSDPEITVFGNSQNILDGDATPSLSDYTDFGSVDRGQVGQSRTFTVLNSGNADLIVGSVTLPNGFNLTEGLDTSLTPGASDTFTVQLVTSEVGTYEGEISFISSDADINSFNFAIIGIVNQAIDIDALLNRPEIETVNTIFEIPDNQLTSTDEISTDGNQALDNNIEDSPVLINEIFSVSDVTNSLNADITAPVITVNADQTNSSTPEALENVYGEGKTIEIAVNGDNYALIKNEDGTWNFSDEAAKTEILNEIYSVIGTTETNDGNPELTVTIDDGKLTVKLTVNGSDYELKKNVDGTWTILDSRTDESKSNIKNDKALKEETNDSDLTGMIDNYTIFNSMYDFSEGYGNYIAELDTEEDNQVTINDHSMLKDLAVVGGGVELIRKRLGGTSHKGSYKR
jgi:CII-binding regulator of phage lambda lysogenization HflD